MIVISDTSPITNLLQIGQLDLIRLVYQRVIIPPAVQHELFVLPQQADLLLNLDWIEVKVVHDQKYVRELTSVSGLDLGEAEAIALAMQEKADWMIVYESLGRAVASKHNIRIIGVLGILIQAKRNNFIVEIRPEIKKLIEIGFRISPKLVNKVLKSVEEPPFRL